MAEQHPIPTESETEIWRPVVGYEANYEASTLGDIRRTTNARGTWAGRIVRSHVGKRGYSVVDLQPNVRTTRRKTSKYVHRLIALTFLAEPTPGHTHVNHKNGVKTDNRLENLEWCSDGENQLHRYRVLGKYSGGAKGSRNGQSKLAEADVLVIRQARSGGESARSIAARYGVTEDTIQLIHSRRIWKHV